MTEWFKSLPAEKRNVYAVLLGIILLTIPCYCLGIAALAAAPPVELPTPTPFGFTATPASTADLPSLVPDVATPTGTPAPADGTPTATLEPTPTQIFPTVPATQTPTPTNTVLPTQTPTGTVPPTLTPTPTATVNTTATAAANATATARAIATAAANATATAAANATATAQAANQPPQANDDTATTPQDTAVVINVIGNDSDPNGNLDPATLTVVNPPANGTASVSGAGQITYTPQGGFSGADNFTYRLCDTQGACDTAVVTVTVTAANSPPVANDDSATTPQDTQVVINVIANDSDVDNNLDLSTVAVVDPPGNGAASVSGGGQISYTPQAGFNGADSFTYQICDTDGACDTAVVTITVTATNSPPVANDDTATTLAGANVPIDVTANDTDPDGNLDPSTVTVVDEPANGDTEVDGNTGQISYTPAGNFTGIDSFTYQICDTEGACDTATVTVTVG